MKRLLPLLAAALILILLAPACTRWHVADRLRDVHTTYTGVNIYQPVDGKIYYREGKNYGMEPHYVIAPEVTYKRRTHLINSDGKANFYPLPAVSQNLRPTGRVVVAEFDYCHGFRGIHPALPEGLVSKEAPKENQGSIRPRGAVHWRPEGNAPMDSLGILSQQEEPPGIGRRLLIGTCDYVVDPLLNIISVPLDLLLFPFGGLGGWF